MADYSSDVTFDCPSCGESVDEVVRVPEPNWTEDKAIDRMVRDDIYLECPNCGDGFDAEVTNSDGHVEMEMTEHPDVSVACGQGYDRAPDDDDAWWTDIPATPFLIFQANMRDARNLLDDRADELRVSTINKMIFVHYFGSLEAYLADTILQRMKADDAVLSRLIEEENQLKETKLSLADILRDPEVVKRTVGAHLREQLFHNLSKVQVLYRIAFAVDIFPLPEVKARLFLALPLRHDCVHRNGRTKDGEEHTSITKPYLCQLAADLESMVFHIEGAIRPNPA